MPNPLFNLLNNSAQMPINTPMGNAMAMLKQFQQFRQSFNGDPESRGNETVKQRSNVTGTV